MGGGGDVEVTGADLHIDNRLQTGKEEPMCGECHEAQESRRCVVTGGNDDVIEIDHWCPRK